MPVDRPNRDRAAAALAAYLRGEIDNFKLDEESLGLKTKDHTLIEISIKIWHHYCDIRRHSVHASPEGWTFLTNCLAYLHSDLEQLGQNPLDCAPFPSDALCQTHQHLIEPDHLPAYDPEKHAGKNYLDEAEQQRNNLIAAAIAIPVLLFFLLRAACR